jgi:hypothetical protein
MNNFITGIMVAFATISAGLTFAAPAYAAGNPLIPVCNSRNGSGTNASRTDVCKDVNSQGKESNPVIRIIKTAILIVSYLAGAMAIIFILISSIRFITASGDSGQIAQARQALTYALVGVAITISAQALVAFVLNKV